MKMKVYLTPLFLLSVTNLVSCGYLTGHHPFPPNLISSRTIIGGAVGGGPSSGAYSASQLTQTVSASPTQVQSSISTYHPSQHGYNNRDNQSSRFNQFTPNQGPNQGYGQNQGQNSNGYNTNIPSVVAYGTYGYGNQDNGGQYQQQSQGQNQGQNHGQNQGYYQEQGGQNQNQVGYYQTQNGYNSAHQGQNVGRF